MIVAGRIVFVEWPRGTERAHWRAGPEAAAFLQAPQNVREEQIRRLVVRAPRRAPCPRAPRMSIYIRACTWRALMRRAQRKCSDRQACLALLGADTCAAGTTSSLSTAGLVCH